jgi:hypothetical protein
MPHEHLTISTYFEDNCKKIKKNKRGEVEGLYNSSFLEIIPFFETWKLENPFVGRNIPELRAFEQKTIRVTKFHLSFFLPPMLNRSPFHCSEFFSSHWERVRGIGIEISENARQTTLVIHI